MSTHEPEMAPPGGASHLLGPGWPEAHPLILLKQNTRQWGRPVSPGEGQTIAGLALKELIREKAAALGLPGELSRYGLSYIKAGAYSQIRRLHADEAPTGWMIELPVDLDARADVIAQNHENFAHFHAIGRNRFVPEPLFLYRGRLPGETSLETFAVSLHGFFAGYEELNFGQGTLRRWNVSDRENPMIAFPSASVAGMLAELIAVMVYHYELDTADAELGTAISGIHVNGGDFIYRQGEDGRPDIKLITVRGRRSGVSIPEFVHSLIQLATAEEMIPDRDKVDTRLGFRVEVPVLISNPSVAFHGIQRGLHDLFEDAGAPDPRGQAEKEARRWLGLFAESDLGQPYAAWTDRYLEGDLELSFGNDLREGQPDQGTLRGIHSELVQLQVAGRDYGDPHAMALTLKFLEERLLPVVES